MNKENVTHMHNGILFGLQKEESLIACDNIAGLG
jgi:hypothetical protein